MSINQRIKDIINFEKVNGRDFYIATKLNKLSMRNIIGERKSKPGFEILEAIANTYPQLNLLWLLTGNEEMWRKEKSRDEEFEKIKKTVAEIMVVLKEEGMI